MGDDLPETSTLPSSDVQAPISGTCEDEDQDEDEMLKRAIELSLRNDDAPECEPRPESKLENYQYSPLPTTDKTIRLLCIPPADDISDTLVCDMHHVRLIDKPEYAALSYTWGAPIFDHHVICNGRRLAITAHLDAALRRFRKTTWWMLWVDALCIDQTNIPERNYQVSIMKHIYSQASRTCVYLGEACPQDEEALLLMRVLGECTKTDYRSSAGLPHPNHPAWEAMQSLFSRPWFSRMWIIQEVVMSSNVVAMLGKFCFPWRLVTDSLRAYIELGIYKFAKLPNMTVASKFQVSGRVVLSLLTVKNDFQCRSLIKLLGSFQQCYSSDPRDKVYALLGLANDQALHQVVSVDYSKSVEAVYLQCAQFLVRNGCGMEMLIQAGTPPEREDTDLKPSLPSWVPDWSREWSNYLGDWQYRAAGQTQSDVELEDGGNGLKAKGIRVDVIDALAPLLSAENDDLISWEPKAREVAQQSRFFSEGRVDGYAKALGLGICYKVDDNNGYTSVDFDAFWNEKMRPNRDYAARVSLGAYYQKFCVTRMGHMGWVPKSSQPGDVIIVLYGCPMLFTVRETDGKYNLLGATYLEGFMNGEALKLEHARPEEFVLE